MNELKLDEIKKIAVPACNEFGVKRLDLFGSLATGENTPESDIDLLVEFIEPDIHLSKRYFGLLHYFEDAFGRDVDLLTANSLKNPYFRNKVFNERVTLFER